MGPDKRVIRAFVVADIPAVARLHGTVFPEGGGESRRTPEAYETWLRDVFVEGPYPGLGFDSLVCEDNGTVIGFLGVVPTRMALDGKRLWATCCTQFGVDPGHRGLAGLQMVRRHMDGPQDLSFSDESEENALRLWEWAGASRIPVASLHFMRPLRPGAWALSLLGQRPALALAARAAAPALALADALLERLPGSHFRRVTPPTTGDELDVATIVASLGPLIGERGLAPVYERDERALAWRLARASGFARRGPLRQTLVRNAAGAELGWYIAYLPHGGTGEVLQVVATPATAAAVLNHMVHDAGMAGVIGLSGRVDPALLQAYSDAYCLFSRRGPWTMVHAKDRALVDRFHRGQVFFSRLEGEWCARFE